MSIRLASLNILLLLSHETDQNRLTQVLTELTDTIRMELSGVTSQIDSLAQQASQLQSQRIAQEIGAAVLRQVLDSQQQQGQALVEMIRRTGLDGAGRLVDRSA